MKISEIIEDKYKLCIPPTTYYDLLADVVEAEEEQEPCEQIKWERDMAIAQLKELGYGLGEKPKTGWIPLKTRPMTEEETEHYFEYTDMRIDDTYTILDCPLPDDGQEVLVSWGGNVCIDTFFKDYDGCYFEGVDIDDVDAWQPLPEPYKAESEDLGDYPDAIHNQFDNMTGSMNL